MPDNLAEYASKYGVPSVTNDYGETRFTDFREGFGRIIFPNGWCASVVQGNGNMYSIAPCDCNGYFDWKILNDYGGRGGCIYCDTEEEAIAACEIIRNL